MILTVYNLLWNAILPIIKRKKRLRIGLEERTLSTLPQQCDIWFHGASAGEITLVITCIQKLSFSKPTRILITTWTSEGKQQIEHFIHYATQHLPLLTITSFYFPFDTKKYITRFLDATKPALIYIAETELWPCLFSECYVRNIPLCIINARMSSSTSNYIPILRRFFIHAYPTRILAISSQDAHYFQQLFPKTQCSTMNNLKFETLTLPHNSPSSCPSSIVFSSIRKKEFHLIAHAIQLLLTKYLHEYSNAPVYIVPRHLHHLKYLQQALKNYTISYTICSHINELHQSRTRCVILNIFGAMHHIYAMARTVFVGGSLIPSYKGHNFLEALTHGIVPLVGPYRSSFAWAEDGLEQEGLLIPLKTPSPDTLAQAVRDNYLHTEVKENIQKRFFTWIKHKQNGTEAVQIVLDKYWSKQ